MKIYLLSIFKTIDNIKPISSKKIRSLGAVCIAEAIAKKFPKEQVEVICIEGNGLESVDDFIFLLGDATHVGFSIYTWSSEILCEVARRLKQSNITLFAGGNDITYYTDKYKEMDLFDVLITGEGELSILDTIEKWLNNKKQDEIVNIPISDLSNIPSPWLSEFMDLSILSTFSVFWELSRGCPFRCSYCCVGSEGGLVRHFSQERIQKEIELFSKHKNDIWQIFVLDSTFNYNKKTSMNIIEKLYNNIPNVPFIFCVRSEYLDEEFIYNLSKLKNVLIRYGIQSIHSNVLKNINRPPIDKKHLQEIQKLCNKYKIKVGVDLILGLPSDTYDGFCESIDFISSLGVYNIMSFTLMIPPISDLYKRHKEWNMEIMKEYPNFILSSNTMTKQDIDKATKISLICNSIYGDNLRTGADLIPMIYSLNLTTSKFMNQLGEYLKIQTVSRHSILDIEIENIKGKTIEFLEKLFTENITRMSS